MTKTGDPLSAKEHRRVGAYAFNFTWSLLDKKRRTPEEDDEMLNASHASRFHWGRGGGPRNRSIGEWQVSRVYAVLGRAEPSAFHGGRALAIARRNHLSPFYVAYGHEALARAAGVAGRAKERDRHLRAAERAGRAIRDPDERRMLWDDLATVR